MARAVVWLGAWLAALAPAVCTMDVHTASGTSSWPVSRLNEFLGPQLARANFTNVPVAWRDVYDLDEAVDCAQFAGHAVFVHNKRAVWTWKQEFKSAMTLQECGAALVVSLSDPPMSATSSYVGFSYHNRDDDCCRSNGDEINVLTAVVWYDWMKFVEDALGRGESVNLTLYDVNHNPWDERLYDHAFFTVLMRGVLCFCNFAIFLLALRVLWQRAQLPARRHSQRPRAFANACPRVRTAHLVLMAVCGDAVGSLLRGVYCAIGPLFCNGTLTLRSHMFLLNISLPIEVMVLCVTVWTFIKLGSSDVASWLRAKRRMTVLWVFAAMSVGTEMAAAYYRGRGRNLGTVVVLSVSAYFVFVGISATLFVVVGLSFLRRLHAIGKAVNHSLEDHKQSANQRVTRRFALWVLCDAASLICQIAIGIVVVSSPETFYSPEGMFGLYFSLFFFASMCSLCQVLAFAPQGQERSGSRSNVSVEENSL